VFAFDLCVVFIVFFVFILVPRHISRESVKIGPHPRGHPSSFYMLMRRKEEIPSQVVVCRHFRILYLIVTYKKFN
jgi:hypothetical protein